MLERLVASRMFHDTRIYVPLARGLRKGWLLWHFDTIAGVLST